MGVCVSVCVHSRCAADQVSGQMLAREAIRHPHECAPAPVKTNLASVLYKIIIYFFCKDHHDHTFYLATNMPTTSNDSTPDHRLQTNTRGADQNLRFTMFEVTGRSDQRGRARTGRCCCVLLGGRHLDPPSGSQTLNLAVSIQRSPSSRSGLNCTFLNDRMRTAGVRCC